MSHCHCLRILLVAVAVSLAHPGAKASDSACDDCLCLQAAVGGTGTYPSDGGAVDIEVTVEHPGACAVTAVAARFSLPPDWSFDSMLTPGPAIPPVQGATGTIEFNYVFVPAFPFSFEFRLLAPAGLTGDAAISGAAVYRTDGNELRTPELTTLIPEPRVLSVLLAGSGAVSARIACGTNCLGNAIVLDAGEHEFGRGATLELSPEAAAGYAFDRWGDDPSGCEIGKRITLDEDRAVALRFAPARMLDIHLEPGNSASVSVDLLCLGESSTRPLTPVLPGTFEVPEGRSAQVAVSPAQDQRFTMWAEPWVAPENVRDNPLTVAVAEDRTLTARLRSIFHSADYRTDEPLRQWVIEFSELLRVIQLFNSKGYHCGHVGDPDYPSPDGYSPGSEALWQNGLAHDADYQPQDWRIDLSELLRIIQFYDLPGAGYCTDKSYHYCPDEDTEDGFCPGSEDMPSGGACTD